MSETTGVLDRLRKVATDEASAKAAMEAEKVRARKAEIKQKAFSDLREAVKNLIGIAISAAEIEYDESREAAHVLIDGVRFYGNRNHVDQYYTPLLRVASTCEGCGAQAFSHRLTGKTGYAGVGEFLATADLSKPSTWAYDGDRRHECPNTKMVMVDTRSGAVRVLDARDRGSAMSEALRVLGYRVEERTVQ